VAIAVALASVGDPEAVADVWGFVLFEILDSQCFKIYLCVTDKTDNIALRFLGPQ